MTIQQQLETLTGKTVVSFEEWAHVIRAEQEAAEKESASWVDEGFEKEQELRHLQPKFRGSEKQQRWAAFIWDQAANQLAHSDLSFEEVKAILLASNMASYWIDRRSEWGC